LLNATNQKKSASTGSRREKNARSPTRGIRLPAAVAGAEGAAVQWPRLLKQLLAHPGLDLQRRQSPAC
ncbi:hypothetical protein GCG54_00012005, partial [Colletotrichum gloeosporioides]